MGYVLEVKVREKKCTQRFQLSYLLHACAKITMILDSTSFITAALREVGTF